MYVDALLVVLLVVAAAPVVVLWRFRARARAAQSGYGLDESPAEGPESSQASNMAPPGSRDGSTPTRWADDSWLHKP
jgi:hypothetical protein